MGVVTFAVVVVLGISGGPAVKGNLLTLLAVVFAGAAVVLGFRDSTASSPPPIGEES